MKGGDAKETTAAHPKKWAATPKNGRLYKIHH